MPEGYETARQAEKEELDRERIRLWYVAATRARFAALAKIYGGITPHSLPAPQRLTGQKILHLVN